MSRGLVIFSHGKESGPWGTKITALAAVARNQGYCIESIDYTDLPDPDARVRRLVERCAGETGPLVLVGSSMGGYVATVASQTANPAGLFLMAPAVHLPGYDEPDPVSWSEKTFVVHGWHDEVIPQENVVRFALGNRARLFLVDGDHTLVSQLPFIEELFGLFLENLES
ncbi:YqiA/YcfP family alpha/beta fold hydrolase [Geobacter sp.]|uniref:YqiA/YcfP family alpha/beta fold hydrolase n=1 Tax=Geobacter sp. TaxID=46610 RepID=UPI0027B92A90|nr:YqiA/YcfP family alpha/beta fold hydrolase [Geobacter sp.]